MMRRAGKAGRLLAPLCAAAAMCLALSAQAYALDAKELVPMGNTVGIQMQSDGVVVVGLAEVAGTDGTTMPADLAGIKPGDKIIDIEGREIKTAKDFLSAAAEFAGEPVTVTVLREDKQIIFDVTPAQNADGAYQLGLWLRDGMTGIGTVTFYDPASGIYGALGHGISDEKTGELITVTDGKISSSSVADVKKGACGAPGELCGRFEGDRVIGTIDMNTDCGIFGKAGEMSGQPMPIAGAEEVKLGAAKILANVSGTEVKEYQVEICRIYRNSADNRCMMLSVTDPELLSLTGGIVQGMSGSPIIQDGKLIGAVTHVLLSDPCRGYGIFIESMLEAQGSQQAAA